MKTSRCSADRIPSITLATSIMASVIGTGVMLATVYSGLSNGDVWQIALCLYFLAILPASGWVVRPKRRT